MLGPAHRMCWVCSDHLTGDKPIKEHAHGCQVLFDGRFGKRMLDLLDIERNMDRLDPPQPVDASALAPGEKLPDVVVVGDPGILVANRHLVARVDGVGALSPTRVAGYAVRTYSGRPRSNIRFRTLLVMATSVACRPSVCERSPPPMTRFQRAISASTRARQLYPEAFCQPMRPRSAIHRRCRLRCVGALSAALLGTAFARGGTTTAASGWRAATSA